MKKEFIATYDSQPLRKLIKDLHGADKVVVPFPKNPSDARSDSEEALYNFLDRDWYAERRFKLEEDGTRRHPIAYGVVAERFNGVWQVFVYQRTKQTAEGRLAGNYSIGIGGHVEASDMFSLGCQDDFILGIKNTFIREMEEEFTFDCGGYHPSQHAVNPSLLIHSDEGVDRYHLGIVPIIVLPVNALSAVSNEPDSTAYGFLSHQEIVDSEVYEGLESWSKKILDDVFAYLHDLPDRVESTTPHPYERGKTPSLSHIDDSPYIPDVTPTSPHKQFDCDCYQSDSSTPSES